MYNPIATYRLQFHQEFTFSDFEQIITYLQKLGVSTIYASPVFEAAPGSTHGYDGVNPHRINPEIGTEKQLRIVSKKLQDKGIGWLQDIVPNHMGVHANNPWLMDVLEKGRRSLYSTFFDTGLSSDLFTDPQIMMPFLGNSLQEVIKNGEINITYLSKQFVFKYFDNTWPLSIQSYAEILQNNTNEPPEKLKPIVKEIGTILRNKDNKKLALKWGAWLVKLSNATKVAEVKSYITSALKSVNENQELLSQIAGQQHYRLCSWQETDSAINYRRFFTVNSLMCLNIQRPEVFAHYHRMIKQLVHEGIFQGLRIDHIDGLYDPENYLNNLRELAGDETYIVAEKILEQGENLPTQWPLQGTTGYDFLAQVNNLLTDSSSEHKFTHFYKELVESDQSVHQQILTKKANILSANMQGELDNLLNYFIKLKLVDDRLLKAIGRDILKETIAQFLIHCPVYRFYGNQMPLNSDEAHAVQTILYSIIKDNKDLKPACDLITTALLEKPYENKNTYNQKALQFYQRLMQFSGPLMAKGVEDTLMYTYNRFVGHNEVGDAPDAFGTSVKDFHKLMKQRQKQWPLAINGTSTHDTKRGEDVRARLNALTALQHEWLDAVKHWEKQDNTTVSVPNANDRYFIYQTIAGAYPMPGQGDDNFGVRLGEYLTKALREGKVNSNWAQPNEDYEKATIDFATGLLDQQSVFWQTFAPLHQNIADHGIVNSLSQLLLKFTSPGVPDVYQGCELWDLSLVDPDNRRPVDYQLRQKLLNKKLSTDSAEALMDLWAERYDGHIKLWLTQQLFKVRSNETELFTKGEYIPLKVKGAYKENIIAFARRYQNKWLIVAAPLYSAALCKAQQKDITAIDWKDTRIILPQEAPVQWQHQWLNLKGKVANDELLISEIFRTLPFALLQLAHPENNRGAGILMHITSLPSSFGIGDMGPGARTFANFLSESGQKYWQLLPINPTGADQKYSPYSSLCSMAGNVLLISPVLLAKDELLDEAELDEFHLPQIDKVNYTKVEDLKHELFDRAYENFYRKEFKSLKQDFLFFCKNEASWLDDFALYSALRENHDGAPWHQWNKSYKTRHTPALARFAQRSSRAIDKIKWLQFIFFRQWQQLKDHCRVLNIRLFGDLPFYVSYDSADVWANQEIFALDKQGNITGIAGVPPDYFNADGQLWGMPVYRWDVLKKQGYQWWINRLRKNMELFDLLRLDHFRAFSAYWEVPAGETTAKNGKWVNGPGADFFNKARHALGNLPLVAEDLGDIDEPVFKLRDQFELPGMKVLQFAFGDDTAQSLYIPHNYDANFFVYTGTHDNNTTLGWYNEDADKKVIKQIEEYTGQVVKHKNINKVLMRMAYASTAKVTIIPMQDILNLNRESRMNNPAVAEHNWLWRMLPKLVDDDTAAKLIGLIKMYNRQ
ncbi:malto-oligosyltrehalose synthase [Mucilaginibacter jinjuensis]|uniref:4-alpha-glucanotransferase n=1 Tax=Mucilaginibacter jinjuensis TaxID=1176721 RepID=A0ABY7T3C9_9SPHI|nr:malto-oligosyltrehalose synthase [Mucilaginibacter jinjuensis]WCT10891.1 malto-oligosyltrehalose synthase [Mucilaginibacter jinjuensis]